MVFELPSVAFILKNLDLVMLESGQCSKFPALIAGVPSPPYTIQGVTPNLRLCNGKSTPPLNYDTMNETFILAAYVYYL